MSEILLTLTMSIATQAGAVRDVKSLIDLIDSLQPRIEDFQCEFEGTKVFKNEEVKKARGLAEDGLLDNFSGSFVWTTGGDVNAIIFHRVQPEGKISRELLVVRAKKHEAERYLRSDDAPIGRGSIADPDDMNADRDTCLGMIFVHDTLVRLAAKENLRVEISEETSEGRVLTVVKFIFKDNCRVSECFWLDLKRGGHAVRRESYVEGKYLVGRVDIKLVLMKVGDVEAWMPVYGVGESHSALKDGKPYFPKDPTSIQTIYINDGTLEFNKHPGPVTFTIKYKPGTPISDSLRKLEYEFGRQKPPKRPTRAETVVMLNEQLADAKAQGKELEAGSPARNQSDWSSYFVWAFGAAALVTSILLVLSRRRG